MTMESVVVTETGGLGPIEVALAEGGGPVTPASRLCVQTIGLHRHLLRGEGIDWGSGTGLLAIALARVPTVSTVIAIEHDPIAVENALRNAASSGVSEKVDVVQADLFDAVSQRDRHILAAAEGRLEFLVANPPASIGDDGLSWRRAVLTGATRYLRPGSNVLLQISVQYGLPRIMQMASDATGYEYRGVLEASGWVPFDLDRTDLWAAISDYANEETRGGFAYEFGNPRGGDPLTASEALDRYDQTGDHPLTQWQVHHFLKT